VSAALLSHARDTRLVHIASGALAEVPNLLRALFAERARAIVIADPRTYAAAGERVVAQLRTSGVAMEQPYLLTSPDLYAEFSFVDELDSVLSRTPAIPVAVGSGTINDLVKLAAHRAGRAYMSVPTAASMDGYTAYGSSVTHRGSKQTFDCPAPLAVVADLEVISRAPSEMNAAGYADLMAKITAGADWILADGLGEDPIDPVAWDMVQGPLRGWLNDPAGVQSGEVKAVENLLHGLMAGGFAMQHHRTSRPASGAEHQFSHLWDMQHHQHQGKVPSHGFKVAIGTLASAALYEQLFKLPLEKLDLAAVLNAWPTFDEVATEIRGSLGTGELAEQALEETRAKHPDKARLQLQLERLRSEWPALRQRLGEFLPTVVEISAKLAAVGAPHHPQHISVSPERLRTSYRQASYIRRRFTVLDLAWRCGVSDDCINRIQLSHLEAEQ